MEIDAVTQEKTLHQKTQKQSLNYNEYQRGQNEELYPDAQGMEDAVAGGADPPRDTKIYYDEYKASQKESQAAATGTASPKAVVDVEGKPKHKGSRRTKQYLSQAVGSAHNKFDQLIEEGSDGNVAAKAAHQYEKAAEYVAPKMLKSTHQAGSKAVKTSLKAGNRAYQISKAYITGVPLPKVEKRKNVGAIQRAIYKKQYQMKRIKENADKFAKAAHSVGSWTGKVVVNFVKANVVPIGILLGMVLLMSVMTNLSAGIFTIITSFVSDEKVVHDVALYITEKDADLQEKYETVDLQPEYGHIDEVVKATRGVLATNPTEVISYLTVRYSDFTDAQGRSGVDFVHSLLYQLEVKEVIEIRTRTVTDTVVDPVTGEEYEETSEEEYEYYLLYVTLTCKTFAEIVDTLGLSDDEKEYMNLLIETGGNMMLGGALGNPFLGYDWRPNITTNYGFRIHPITKRKEMHPATDIAMNEGTEINAVHKGIVIEAVHGDTIFGNYIVIEDTETKLKSKYAHCSALSASRGDEVERGDVIAAVGNTGQSTGPHLHIEIYRKGERKNPITELSFN